MLLPLKDGMPRLKEAVESILAQDLRELELIVIDDGSRDGGPEWARSRSIKDARLRLLAAAEPLGIAHALNRGLVAARGEWIARMDHDDVSPPHRLTLQLEHADQHGLDLVSCQVTSPGASEGFQRYIDWQNGLLTPKQISLARFVESPLVHPTVCFRRGLCERFGSWRQGDFPEDYELWLRWLQAGARMGKCDRELLVWHDSAGRLTRVDDRYHRDRFAETRAGYLKEWLSSDIEAGRPLWVWGAGRRSRELIKLLWKAGVRHQAWLDIDPHKIGQRIWERPVHEPGELIRSGHRAFVIVNVASWGAREEIAAELGKLGRQPGRDWIAAA